MTKFFYVLGFIWALPVVILWWLFYILPLLLLRNIQYVGAEQFLIYKFVLVKNNSWYHRQWERWSGFAGPGFFIITHRIHGSGSFREKIAVFHEIRHCQQIYFLGILFYILYGLLWLIYRYKNHPLEKDARKFAMKKAII